MRLVFLFTFLIGSCASTELSRNGRTVVLATAMSPTELNSYEELAPLNCAVGNALLSQGSEEDCKNTIRNRAADLGADLVVIEGYNRDSCPATDTKGCVSIYARAYRRKINATNSYSHPPSALLLDLPPPTGN